MEVLYPRCAGLDVHKVTVVAAARVAEGGRVRREVRRFGTTTREVLALADWLTGWGITHVAMEATGVYWKPVWHLLEGSVELVLANAAHIRQVPGRKSDVNDAEWIADLLAHGLIRASFVPPGPVQELRELTRTRTQRVRELGQHTQRVQKVLEGANVKLASVISDVGGASGRAILEALVAGETDPERLAALGSERLQCSREALVEALRGRVTPHHRFLLRQHLAVVDHLRERIAAFDAQLEAALAPFREAAERLTGMPGVARIAARGIVGELGVDMTRFPSAAHVRSWVGLCPRLDESAGKKRSTRLRHGAPWLKPLLIQCAWAAVRKEGSYFRAQYLRLKSRRGAKKAIVAVAASMLTAIYHMLRDGLEYRDLGGDYFTRRDKAKIAQRLTRRLMDLGYTVEVHATA